MNKQKGSIQSQVTPTSRERIGASDDHMPPALGYCGRQRNTIIHKLIINGLVAHFTQLIAIQEHSTISYDHIMEGTHNLRQQSAYPNGTHMTITTLMHIQRNLAANESQGILCASIDAL